ncbi:MAG: EamA family transporter [Patescibacteria group bacterium]|nr:EamA family transporter [Patescibacteria group bacterium]
MWLLIAFLSPVLYAWANVFDNFIIGKFKTPFTLSFYSSLSGLVFAPILFLVQRPALPPVGTWPVFVGLGAVNILYLYPYYRALQTEDTSVVVSLFSLSRIWIPILAFLIVGEVLAPAQYIGIFIITVASISLGLSRRHLRLRLSQAFWWMILAAFITSFEGVFLKYLYDRGVGWSTAVGGELLMSVVLMSLLFVNSSYRRSVAAQFPRFKQMLYTIGVEETFTFLAFAASSFAITLAPVSAVSAISLFTPFFALFYAGSLSRRLPRFFKEKIDGGSVIKKSVLFAAMILGVILVAS